MYDSKSGCECEKGMHKDLLENLSKEGFVRVRIDGQIQYIEEVQSLEKNKNIRLKLLWTALCAKTIVPVSTIL